MMGDPRGFGDPYGYGEFARELVKELLGPKAYGRITVYDPSIIEGLEELVVHQHMLTYNMCDVFRLRFSGPVASDRAEWPAKGLTPKYLSRVQDCVNNLVRKFSSLPSFLKMKKAGAFDRKTKVS